VGIYRVHKEIGKKQASILQNYITRVDPTLCSLKHIHNRQDVYQLINLITSKDDVNLNSILMQYLPRAYYSSEASRHFGLNLKYYTHFTSPIRRYADFIIHHLLSSLISNKEISRNILAILKSVSEQCSKQEQVISAITNEMANYYKFVKLADNLGTHDGFYRTIVPTGMLVYLPKYDILCCVEKLPSYHKFKSLSFGAPVKIDIISVCMVTMTISAKLLEFC
jgi:ribonuclease R